MNIITGKGRKEKEREKKKKKRVEKAINIIINIAAVQSRGTAVG